MDKRIIPYGSQWICSEDIDSVKSVFDTGWITQGPKIRQFEEAVADYCGVKYAVAVSSGTAALHIAVLAAGLKKGDTAITTPMTFLATSNSVLYSGASPVFADIDIDTVNISVAQIKKKITKRTKAILPVDFAGLPCDLAEIKNIAEENGLTVIEDACHALGATYKDSRTGDCRYSAMTIFSFHPVKHITTGEGGMVTTNSAKLYEKLLALRNHGMYKHSSTVKKEGPWYYEMEELGFNYRITDLQTALGLSQMNKLDSFLERRRGIVKEYDKAFAELGDLVILPEAERDDRRSAWHLYLFRLNKALKYITRREFFEELHRRGIKVQVHYIPITRQPYYRKQGFKRTDFPNAEKYYKSVVSLPLYPRMTDEDVDYVVKNVKEII
ncbi:MAG: UDP-4-amino-4,6-dideoxy-N-acetyl-beta-L-altrosamine transaminase, partial [Candidatus Omnitrophica bacterium]|nr:UDP-4-amino-4,6-dideoxy-N-acetyl-beta-L-altrosamine transaminase [Candidatus Omnitrophota bacterium]